MDKKLRGGHEIVEIVCHRLDMAQVVLRRWAYWCMSGWLKNGVRAGWFFVRWGWFTDGGVSEL